MQKINKQGEHTHISNYEIDKIYNSLENEYDIYIKQYNVKLPKKNSMKALWLIYLRKYIGQLVHKDTISEFVQSLKPTAGKDQQVRHLASDGWYVLNKGDKIPNQDKKITSGYHVLFTVENPKPNFLHKALKRAGRISAQNFEQLKVIYDFRCATCGSIENKPHILEPVQITSLQQGHMDPHIKLTLDNTIPQYQLCNQIYQDNYVFNKKGRIIAVTSTKPVKKAHENVKKEIKNMLNEIYNSKNQGKLL